ncbi:MAG TPA: cell division topological specificity factor MinE [Thermomicrobiales bacterium]|nr:cell division topological specificity factor MinE [Thermomicrobiales bacterium]
MNWIDTLLGRKPAASSSASVAKQRLVEVLVQDHVKLTPDVMDAIRRDISAVLSRHLDVDVDALQISVTRSGRGDNLVANVPVRRTATSR